MVYNYFFVRWDCVWAIHNAPSKSLEQAVVKITKKIDEGHYFRSQPLFLGVSGSKNNTKSERNFRYLCAL